MMPPSGSTAVPLHIPARYMVVSVLSLLFWLALSPWMLAEMATSRAMTARGIHRTLRVARTIADLAGDGEIGRGHVAEALSYRRQPPRA